MVSTHSFDSRVAVVGTLTMSLGSLKRGQHRAFNVPKIIAKVPVDTADMFTLRPIGSIPIDSTGNSILIQ